MPRRQGHLLIIGGSEARHDGMPVLTRFVELCGGVEREIAIVTAASDVPDEVWEQYRHAFTELGARKLTHVRLDSPAQASGAKAIGAIRRAQGIFLTGGAQQRLMRMLRGTPLPNALRSGYRERGVCIAGTSAGASAMSQLMVVHGRAALVPEKGAITLESGLGLVSHMVVDQHFAQRGRLPRLLSVIAEHPDQYGVGIDEDTALAICPGEGIDVVGEGGVTVVDGRTMLSNLEDIGMYDSPCLVDVRLHVLPSGTRYSAAAVDGRQLPPAPLRDFFQALMDIAREG